MRRRPGLGVLTILALMLAASGALRLGAGVGEAIASGTETAAGADAPDGPLACPTPPLALVEALTLREGRLAVREVALDDRLAALDLAEAAVAARLAALEAAEAKLSATLSQADGAAEDDLARLTTVYETMRPKDAAQLFAAMDPEFAAGFLGRMRPDASAAILAGMEAEAAYAVSAILAGRNARAPTE